MLKIAVALDDSGKIFPGHFAHAKRFRIFEYNLSTGEAKILGERDNELGKLPDFDDVEEMHSFINKLGIPLHGIPKYKWLKDNVLHDIDVVVAGGACQTSYNYFMEEGVVVLFEEPGGSVESVFNLLREVLK